MESLRLEVLKVPLGIIRLLQIPFAILAFSTTAGYKGCLSFKDSKDPVCWTYPFQPPLWYNTSSGGSGPFVLYQAEFYSSAVFFVFTGVVAFMYSSAILIGYMICWERYASNVLFPKIDFLLTSILTIFWFAGSCAWADGVEGLKSGTSVKSLANNPNHPIKDTTGKWDYASLNVSLIVGFAMVGLYGSNLWFIYKETRTVTQSETTVVTPVAPKPQNSPFSPSTSTAHTTSGYQQ